MRRPCETSVEIEIPFHDVDALGVVWHGHYFKYLELARTALLRPRGLDAGDLIPSRYGFLVIESRCRYSAPLRYGDRARVDAWLRDTRRRIAVAFEVHNLTLGRRSARAHTVLAITDAEGRLLLETPSAIRERLAG
jgi:acyl-CoA thioester hydrolase